MEKLRCPGRKWLEVKLSHPAGLASLSSNREQRLNVFEPLRTGIHSLSSPSPRLSPPRLPPLASPPPPPPSQG